MKKDEMIGQKIGHWLILGQAPSIVSPCGTSRKAFYCRCDCGKEKIVAKTQLKNGKSKSCGCGGIFLSSGQQFNEWTVLRKSEITNKHNDQFYDCICSCGVKRAVRMSDLTNNSSKNCGHSRLTLSEGAQAIKNLLIELDISFYQEYTFKELPNRRYDFAIYKKNEPQNIIRLIEFDGEQHIRITGGWNNKESFEKRLQHDLEKNNFALQKHIPLIRIPHYIIQPKEIDLFGNKYLIEGD